MSRVKAYGKVNLALDVFEKRSDGLHEMDMVNAQVDLADELVIESTESQDDEIVCETLSLPEDNTLIKTLRLLRKNGLKGHYKITLYKTIPDQAGLGGGSADAAALLKALNEIESLGLSLSELEEIGFQIGADVPCCLHEGFTRVQGAGEVVEDLDIKWKIPIILAKCQVGISTKQAFEGLEAKERERLDIDIVQDAVRKKDLGLLYQTMVNAFEPLAFEMLPEVHALKEKMLDAGLVRVMMSGSGSCLMGFCVDEDVREQAYQILKKNPDLFVWKGSVGRP